MCSMLLDKPMDRLTDDPRQGNIAFLGDGCQGGVILVIEAHGQSGGLFSALGHFGSMESTQGVQRFAPNINKVMQFSSQASLRKWIARE